jgi:DNA-binding PadR family transcriptional regulator
MYDEHMSRQLLSDFELMTLLAVLRLGDGAYGVAIARELESTAGRRVLSAALYAALGRLESKGLVTTWLGEPTPERGGRAKKFFRVTGRGLEAVRHTRGALEAMWAGLPVLEGGTP